MRLSESSKKILLGNVELLRYCKSGGISIEKIKRCNIEKMGDTYVFVLNKENTPISKNLIPLDVDLLTQPDVVLIMDASNRNLEFKTTEKTIRLIQD